MQKEVDTMKLTGATLFLTTNQIEIKPVKIHTV
jgi:hypothetical protein